ncbi:hypothetical protein NQ315_004744 [Exocentrus adspersus]|uniref:Activator of basal transcription 1 n=1 Tax=Exocentrus adspersus TaxID=1586481 RepID=A0AAV8W219_9CUCU|nr:hypothetical protein NQ315_004744 [Exocentrus adspersus]
MDKENTNSLSVGVDSVSKKPPKHGIIYLSSIPPYMNVSRIREIFGEFGTVGRVYLQLADKEHKKGWVELERKSVAKKVAALLNNTQVSNRKKSKQYDHIWNIKYLSSFKWAHLHERLIYEKAARRQKIREQIESAKEKSNIFSLNLNKGKKNKNYVNKEYEQLSSKNDATESKGKEMNVVSTEDRAKFLKGISW